MNKHLNLILRLMKIEVIWQFPERSPAINPLAFNTKLIT